LLGSVMAPILEELAPIDATSQTRKRKSHTKVRTGCFTCK
jgi:hypothetical protein